MTTTANPKKLRDGTWGAWIDSAAAESGMVVLVQTKSGKTWEATVDRVLWQGRDGAICSTTKRESSRRTRGGCVSGGNCSSFGSGRSCGAHDCDGY